MAVNKKYSKRLTNKWFIQARVTSLSLVCGNRLWKFRGGSVKPASCDNNIGGVF